MIQFEPILIFLTTILFLYAFLSIIWTGGIRNNIFHSFIVFVQLFYFFNTPAHQYNNQLWFAFNTNVKDYFTTGFLQIFLHLLFYLIGYSILSRKINNHYPEKITKILPEHNALAAKWVVRIFFVLYAVIFLNTLYSGINLIDIVAGKSDTTTLGLKGGTYYLQNFADSLITLLVAAYYFKVKTRYFILMIVLGFILFIILGFRYRLLLTIFGFCMVYVFKNKIRTTAVLKYLTIGVTTFYFFMFITHNRMLLYTQRYDKISFDPTEFHYDYIYAETFGSVVDISLYKAYHDGVIQNDFGYTMFVIVFVKMTPSRFFPNGQKPYPPPQLLAIDKALNVPRDYGQATTAIGGLFYAFNYPGIYIGAFCLGLLIGKLQRRINATDVLAPLVGIVVAVAMFQWLTRGYFPAIVDHLAYLTFPLFVLRRYFKKYTKVYSPAV